MNCISGFLAAEPHECNRGFLAAESHECFREFPAAKSHECFRGFPAAESHEYFRGILDAEPHERFRGFSATESHECFRGFPAAESPRDFQLQNLSSDRRKSGHFHHILHNFSLYCKNMHGLRVSQFVCIKVSEQKPCQIRYTTKHTSIQEWVLSWRRRDSECFLVGIRCLNNFPQQEKLPETVGVPERVSQRQQLRSAAFFFTPKHRTCVIVMSLPILMVGIVD